MTRQTSIDVYRETKAARELEQQRSELQRRLETAAENFREILKASAMGGACRCGEIAMEALDDIFGLPK